MFVSYNSNYKIQWTKERREKGKILIYKIPHIKLKIVHDEPHNKEKPGSKLRCSGMVYSSSFVIVTAGTFEP
jgi:hypothetical protein